MLTKPHLWIALASFTILSLRLAHADEQKPRSPFHLVRTAIANEDFTGALQQLERMTIIGDPDNEERLYLRAHVLANLPGVTLEQLADATRAVILKNPSGRFAEESLYLYGMWQYRKGELGPCQQTLTEFTQLYPDSAHRVEAVFYTARCIDQLGGDHTAAKKLLIDVYENAPSAPFAGEAYFYVYPYEEYLVGNLEATAHLQQMGLQFPQSPYLIVAHYLKGMDIKKTQLAKEAHQRQQWNQAIESFQQAETLFESLIDQGLLPEEHSDYFTALRFRAGIERAQANLAIAVTSSSAKRQICLEYTIASYRELLQLLREGTTPHLIKFARGEIYQPLLEECHFGLAQAYLKSHNDALAESILRELLQFFNVNATSRGYYLAKTHMELATIAMRRGDYTAAFKGLVEAEEAAKGRVLSTDERLELWILQSLCQRELGNSEAAMLLLSKVINDDSISGLRLKAMLLRADMYQQQGRPELAQKQLIALTRKGGDWARQAKVKLEKDYGHH